MSRHASLLVLAALLVASAAPGQDRPLRLGLVPYTDPDRIRADYQPVAHHLAAAVGRPVEVVIPDRYADVPAGLADGSIDLAVLPPFVYVEAIGAAIARPLGLQVGTSGRTTYSSLIITAADGEVRQLADLAGRSFAFVDPKSSSGYLFPVALLIREGHDPTRFFGRTVFAGDHAAAVRMVTGGQVDAAATNDVQLAELGIGDEVRILIRTPGVPQESFVASTDLDRDLVERLGAALLTYAPAAADSTVQGWQPADDALYEEVRHLLAFSRERVRLALATPTLAGEADRKQADLVVELLASSLRATGRFRPVAAGDGAAEATLALHLVGLGPSLRIEGRLLEAAGEEAIVTIRAEAVRRDDLGRAVDRIAAAAAARFPARGFVVSVEGEGVVLDLGSRDGLRVGDAVEFLVWGRPITNPVTGQVVRRSEVPIGSGTVERVEDEIALCRVERSEASIRPGVWARVRAAAEDDAAPAAPAWGGLRVVSDPPGAAIFLDDEATGHRTPHLFESLATRDHVVRVELDGYRTATDVARVEAGDEPAIVHLDLDPYWTTDVGLWVLGGLGSLLAVAIAGLAGIGVRRRAERLRLTEAEWTTLEATLPRPLACLVPLVRRRRGPIEPTVVAGVLDRLLDAVLLREHETRLDEVFDDPDVRRRGDELRERLLAGWRPGMEAELPWSAEVVAFLRSTGRGWALAGQEVERLGRRLQSAVLLGTLRKGTIEDLQATIERGGPGATRALEVLLRQAAASLRGWRLIAVGPGSTALDLTGPAPRPPSLGRALDGPGVHLIDAYEIRPLDLSPLVVHLDLPEPWSGPRTFFLDRFVPAAPETSEYVSFDRGEAERRVLSPGAWEDLLAGNYPDPEGRRAAGAVLAGWQEALRAR